MKKVFLSNWVNLVAVIIAAIVYVFSTTLFRYNIIQSVFVAILVVLGYGIRFWVIFIMALLITDLIFFKINPYHIKAKLLLQWLIISLPFIYWGFLYKEWVFLIASVAFLISQFMREKMIKAN